MGESHKASRRTFLQNAAAGALAISLSHAGYTPRATGSTLQAPKWRPLGLGGYGHMLTPAISPDPDVMVVNCDMGGVYYTRNGGLTWDLFPYAVLQSNVQCRPAFHPDFQKNRLLISGSVWGEVWQVHLPPAGEPTSKQIGYIDLKEFDRRLQGEIAIDPSCPNIMLVGATNESNFSGLRLFEQDQACHGIGLNAQSKQDKIVNEIWYSADAGSTWTKADISESIGETGFVLGFHFDRSNKRRIYAATQRKLLLSEDRGATWQEAPIQGFPLGPDKTHDVIRSFAGASDPQSLFLYIAIPNRCAELTKNEDCQSSCADNTRVGLYCSEDGKPWQAVQTAGIDHALTGCGGQAYHCQRLQFHHVLATNAAPRTVYAFNAPTGDYKPQKHSQAFRSNDAGLTWRPTFLPPEVPEELINVDWNWWSAVTRLEKMETPSGVAICPTDPERAIATGTRCFVRSQHRWRCGDSPTPVAAPGPKTKWVCNGLVVTAVWNYVIDSKHKPDRHFIAYTDCGYARSEDAGQSWLWLGDTKEKNKEEEKEKWKLNAYDLILDPRQSDHMWAAFSAVHDIPNYGYIWREGEYKEADKIGRIGYSFDAGDTWHYGLNAEGKELDAPATSIVRGPEQNAIARLYASVYANEKNPGGVYVSDDDGCCWKRLEIPGLPQGKEVRYWKLSLHSDGTLFLLITGRRCGSRFVSGEAGLYQLKPDGERWELLGKKSPLNWPRGFSVDPSDSRNVLIAASEPAGHLNEMSQNEEAGIYQLSDDRLRWDSRHSCSYRYFGVDRHATRPNWIYATANGNIGGTKNTGPGLWLSQDGGGSFKAFDDFPFRHVHRVVTDPQDPDSIYVCTSGAGVWHGPAVPNA